MTSFAIILRACFDVRATKVMLLPLTCLTTIILGNQCIISFEFVFDFSLYLFYSFIYNYCNKFCLTDRRILFSLLIKQNLLNIICFMQLTYV